jgi:hypothetical protein
MRQHIVAGVVAEQNHSCYSQEAKEEERARVHRSFLFFSFVVLGFELRAYTLSHFTSPFWGWIFLR